MTEDTGRVRCANGSIPALSKERLCASRRTIEAHYPEVLHQTTLESKSWNIQNMQAEPGHIVVGCSLFTAARYTRIPVIRRFPSRLRLSSSGKP